MYEKPYGTPPEAKPVSLLDLVTIDMVPSLTKRINLAHAIAQGLMYLHSVNWLHKSLRSNSILFFPTTGADLGYASPIISGFDYARPDFPGEVTERPKAHSKHDIYRHPSTLTGARQRSTKSHDIYSLGIVLIEIAY
jgi:serine/threonine protein kinase